MNRIIILTVICILILSGMANAQFTKENYEAVYDSIRKIRPDFEKSWEVEDFEFSMDAATFTFGEGTIYFLNTIAGHTIGFYFDGKGRCRVVGPTPIEKFSIEKFTGEKDFDKEFDDGLFFFSQDIYEEFFSHLELRSEEKSGKLNSRVKRFLGKLKDYSIDAASAMIPRLYTSKENPYLLTIFDTGDDFVFQYDPTNTESVELVEFKSVMGHQVIEVITRFFPSEHYQSGKDIYEREQIDQAYPLHYDINTTIEQNTDLIAECKLIFQSNQDSLIRLWFNHSDQIDMDSVKTSDGTSLAFDKFKEDDAYFSTVFFNRPLMQGEVDTLIFYYESGDVIKKSVWGDFYLLAPAGWYPELGFRNKATFSLRYRTPEWLRFLSCGDKVKDSVDGDWRYTVWENKDPIQVVGFNYGWFDSLTVVQPGLPEIKIFRSDASHRGRLFGPNMLDVTAEDVTAAVEFCTNVYGAYPYDRLLVTEIPLAHGQSFPGLLHLGWASFERDDRDKGFEMDAFRAHEVAHQWWPTIVHFKSYHDQWMSEGFAEYTSAWFVQTKDGDNKRFLRLLDDWKDIITQKGSLYTGSWSEGSEAGPIWLGGRLASTESQDYSTLVYTKGAYVLHMLRMMLHDYDNHSDDNFVRMMQRFVKAYSGKKASTRDFQDLTERYFGMDMAWFFDQWIFSTEIPRYKPEYEVLEEDGNYIVQATIKTEDVPENFKMVVPLVVEFENDSHTILKFWVKGHETVYRSKPMPYKPKNFILNPYKAVLCHVD
ncbi:MAG TPA: hypothetical protein ENO22_11755 [candidate division Zixibacteria bacterium]|nr:hypothetical protein [candidate division Zixibacteria bacterium]